MTRLEELEYVCRNADRALTALSSDEKFDFRVKRHVRKMRRANAKNTIGDYALLSLKSMVKQKVGGVKR